jgi:hypothetical protein
VAPEYCSLAVLQSCCLVALVALAMTAATLRTELGRMQVELAVVAQAGLPQLEMTKMIHLGVRL